MRFWVLIFSAFLLTSNSIHAQDACTGLSQLAAARSQQFDKLKGVAIAASGETQHFRSSVVLPGFDQNYFEQYEGAPPAFTARKIGFESLIAAGKALDSVMQQFSYCLRGYTFYKEENCRLGCNYYVAPNESQEVLFYVSYLEEPGEPWYAITLTMPSGKPMQLPSGLTLLTATHPPLDIPQGKLDACQTMQLYLKAGMSEFRDLKANDGSLKINYPEAIQTNLTKDGSVRILLAEQTGDEETELDEVYFITQSMLNQCLSGWSQLELTREDDADFLNDRQWLKDNQQVSLKYEISKGGKGKNSLVLMVTVR